MSTRRLAALLAAPLLLVVAAPAALADQVTNSLDGTIDATAEVMPLNADGAPGSTALTINPTGGDGKSGCNLTGQTALSLALSSSDTSVATVSPSNLTFTSCSDSKTLTVTPKSTGTATISASLTSNTSQGSFDLAPATFRVNVAPAAPANTAPSLSIVGVADGASYAKGAVPAAGCEVSDAEDGASRFPATLSDVTGPYAADGIGAQTASCSYTDHAAGGGLTAASSVTYTIVDDSAPVIGYTLDPATADGDNGWYHGEVHLTWQVTEPESPHALTVAGCEDQTVTADQAPTGYACSASSAGGTADPVSVSIKRDGSAPNAPTPTSTPAPNAAGWNDTPVTVAFTSAGDNGPSGVASCTSPVTVGADTAGQEVTGTCTDSAGNTGPAASTAVRLDLTPPSTPTLSTLADGAAYDFGDVPAAPTCTATDVLSGLDRCDVSGYSNAVGAHTVTATAYDVAGNHSTSTTTYTVRPYRWSGFYAPVDMGGVVNTVKAGSTVPLKFEVFTSTRELTSTSVIQSLTAREVSCSSYADAQSDPVELTATGGTALRYDTTAGQFIQNWKTPATPSKCYAVTVTTDDGQSHGVAVFKTK